MMYPIVISHAACEGLAPRNSLEGIEVALGLGIKYIEIDVQVTKDGIPILAHDPILKLPNGKTLIVPATDAELLVGQSVYVYSDKREGLTMPLGTLKQALDLMPEDTTLIIEIKHPRFDPNYKDTLSDLPALKDNKLENAILYCVESKKAQNKVNLISFFPEVLLALKDFDTQITHGFVSHHSNNNILAVAKALDATYIASHHESVSKNFVRETHREGLSVFVWTVDEELEIARLARIGVNGIITNRPDRALKVLQVLN